LWHTPQADNPQPGVDDDARRGVIVVPRNQDRARRGKRIGNRTSAEAITQPSASAAGPARPLIRQGFSLAARARGAIGR